MTTLDQGTEAASVLKMSPDTKLTHKAISRNDFDEFDEAFASKELLNIPIDASIGGGSHVRVTNFLDKKEPSMMQSVKAVEMTDLSQLDEYSQHNFGFGKNSGLDKGSRLLRHGSEDEFEELMSELSKK